jgi:hypothetical protein
MPGRAAMGAEATGASGTEATGGEALGLGSASDRSGGRIGGHTGDHTGGHTGADTGDAMPTLMPIPMAIPMAMRTRRWSLPHRPKCISNPHPRRPFSHRPRGITVTTYGGITPTCSNVQGDGGQLPLRRHKPEAAGPRADHPARVSSVPRCDRSA